MHFLGEIMFWVAKRDLQSHLCSIPSQYQSSGAWSAVSVQSMWSGALHQLVCLSLDGMQFPALLWMWILSHHKIRKSWALSNSQRYPLDVTLAVPNAESASHVVSSAIWICMYLWNSCFACYRSTSEPQTFPHCHQSSPSPVLSSSTERLLNITALLARKKEIC